MIIWADVLVAAVLHPEAAGDGAELDEAEALVEVPGMDIVLHYRIELHNSEAVGLRLGQAVGDQLLSQMSAAAAGIDGVARIRNVAAAADVVGMQDVEADNIALLLCHAAIGLCRKKIVAALLIEAVQLGKGHALLHHLIPDPHHRRDVFFIIASDDHAVPPYRLSHFALSK